MMKKTVYLKFPQTALATLLFSLNVFAQDATTDPIVGWWLPDWEKSYELLKAKELGSAELGTAIRSGMSLVMHFQDDNTFDFLEKRNISGTYELPSARTRGKEFEIDFPDHGFSMSAEMRDDNSLLLTPPRRQSLVFVRWKPNEESKDEAEKRLTGKWKIDMPATERLIRQFDISIPNESYQKDMEETNFEIKDGHYIPLSESQPSEFMELSIVASDAECKKIIVGLWIDQEDVMGYAHVTLKDDNTMVFVIGGELPLIMDREK